MKKELIVLAVFLICLTGVSAAEITLDDDGSTAVVNIADAVDMYSYEVVLNYTGSINTASLNDGSAFSSFLGEGAEATYSYKLETGNKIYVYGSKLDPSGEGVTGSGNLFNVSHSAGDVGLWSLLSISTSEIEEGSDGTIVAYVEEAEPYCGDNSCSNGENCATCSADCGACPATSGGGGGTTLQYYSIKLVTPGDIVVSEENYIEIPVSIENTGGLTLQNIKLRATATFNDKETNDVQVVLAKTFIQSLETGKAENFLVKLNVNTKEFGRYKVTIYADVESPQISDYGDFYVELKRLNASETEEILIFAEKLISKNDECLELTEVVKEARKLYEQEDYRGAVSKLKEAIDVCTATIAKKEKTYLQKDQYGIFYIVFFVTLVLLILGLIVYIYQKSKLNKHSK